MGVFPQTTGTSATIRRYNVCRVAMQSLLSDEIIFILVTSLPSTHPRMDNVSREIGGSVTQFFNCERWHAALLKKSTPVPFEYRYM